LHSINPISVFVKWLHKGLTNFWGLIRKKEKDLNRQLRESNKELGQATQRIRRLDEIIQRIYEGNLDDKVSDKG